MECTERALFFDHVRHVVVAGRVELGGLLALLASGAAQCMEKEGKRRTQETGPHMQTDRERDRHTQTQRDTQTHSYTDTQTQTQTQTQTRTHARAHIDTHTGRQRGRQTWSKIAPLHSGTYIMQNSSCMEASGSARSSSRHSSSSYLLRATQCCRFRVLR
jgi:hypothetical protein